MSEEIVVLKEVTQKLNTAGIPYMVSGSVAVNYYTTPRMTRDIDIVINLDSANLHKFFSCFKDNYYLDKETIKEELKHNGMFNLIHNKYIIKIDFIVHKKTEFQTATFQRRKQVKLDNTEMWIISVEDLIIAKLIWAKDTYSELQLKDIRNLFKTVEDLDLTYIEDWVKRLNLHLIYKKAREKKND